MICILVAGSIYGDRTVDNKNGTLTDKKTGLTWELCKMEDCSDYDYFDAKERCDSLRLAGRKWRLPTMKELITIYDYDKSKNIPLEITRSAVWSESTANESYRYAGELRSDFPVLSEKYKKSDVINTICVSGEVRNNVFVDNNNGTVMDKSTKLLWQKCSIGQENDYLCSGGTTSHNLEDAKKQCQNLKLAGKKWRLPTIEELQSLLLFNKTKSFIDIRFFPNSILMYWSSSTYAQDTNSAWYVNGFNNGFNMWYVGYSNKTDSTYYVRCVTDP